VPWSSDDSLRGPQFLVDGLVTHDGCDAETAQRTAAALRAVVGKTARV
jgi:hypothetical protein